MRRALKLNVAIAAVTLAGFGVYGCRASLDGGDTADLASSDTARDAGGMPQVMNAGKMATVKKSLPGVAFPARQALLDSAATMWCAKESMVPCYQDSVGDGSYTPAPGRLAAPTPPPASRSCPAATPSASSR